ncbi:Ig-like domain-containing protein [Candidatus Margulisiibacteriota bacterium]
MTYITATAVGRNLFNFPVFSVPATATITNLSIFYRYYKLLPQACNIRSALLVGGTNYDTVDPGVDPASKTTWYDRTYDYSTNPKSGGAWTADDINGVGVNALQAFGVYSSDASPNLWVSQIYATVTYTVPNSAPIGGYTADNVIPAAQCVQATDGSGLITISFRVKDADLDPCTLKTFQYSTNGGAGWSAPTGGDASGSLSTGWANNGGLNYTSAADFSGPVYSFTFNTKHGDVSGINGTDQNDIRIRFTVNDGALDSTLPATSDNFSVDDLNPATLVNTDLTARPIAGDTAVTLLGSFTEAHPNTNTFYLAYNGGAYGSGSAGDSNTAAPAAHSTPVGAPLDGNDYISKVKIDHVDDLGNAGTNENPAPSTAGVTPYTPAAPTVGNPTATTVDVVVNKNASEPGNDLTYAIYESTTAQYVQAGGNLGAGAVWQTIAAWGTKTVTGLSVPVSQYVFQTKSMNPNGDNPESDFSSGASSANSAPTLHNGAAENVLPALAQYTDATGQVTITFRIKDLDVNNCSVVSGSFQYNVNGAGWNNILDADITGTKTGLSSATDLSGALHTLVWDRSKEYIDNAYNLNVLIRFQVSDGTVDSVSGVSPSGFNIDNLDPAVLTPTNVAVQPTAGNTLVTLDSSFTEQSPNTNTFYLAINGGAYGSSVAGTPNTAAPAPQTVEAGVTLDGNDYVSKVSCDHVDDFGNAGTNENLSPEATRKYVKPYTPADPTVDNATATTVDVRVNRNPSEATGLEYAIYVSSHSQYVQSAGTLAASAVWQNTAAWGAPVTVSGLSGDIADYVFKTKSRNSSDAAHLASSESGLSNGVNTSGVPPTPEAVASYSPAAGADGVSPEAVVTIGFDRDMNTTSVQNVFTMEAVYDHTGASISQGIGGAFSWAANRTLTYTPSVALTKGYTYRVTVSGTIQDYDSNSLTIDLSWSFRTRLDRTIQNIFTSPDGRVRVELATGAMSNDGSIDINRQPLVSAQQVDPSAISIANSKAIAQGDPFFYPIEFFISEINAYGTDNVRITSDFEAPVTVTMFYDDENGDGYLDGTGTDPETNPYILVSSLRLYRLDETHSLWVRVPGSIVTPDLSCVSTLVPHFSVYTLMARPAETLTEAYAYPNPFKPGAGHTIVTFTNLASECTIKIFTLTGELVRTILETDGDGVATWDVKNESGEDVASGLYLFAIKSGDDLKRGKLAVIR